MGLRRNSTEASLERLKADEPPTAASGEPFRRPHRLVESGGARGQRRHSLDRELDRRRCRSRSDANAVLIAGAAGLVAGAMSMAAGEYVSVSSQADSERADLARERKELSENPGIVELDELAEIYVKRGVDRDLARQVARQLMAKDALAAHAHDELGISRSPQPARCKPHGVGRILLRWRGHAVTHGDRVAHECARPDRVRCVVGLSRSSRRDRGKSRRRERPARHRPRDILGRWRWRSPPASELLGTVVHD